MLMEILIAAFAVVIFIGVLCCCCGNWSTKQNKSDLARTRSLATATETDPSREGQNQHGSFDDRGQIVNHGTQRVPGQTNNTASRPPRPSNDVTRQRIVHQVSRHSQLPSHNSSSRVTQPSCSSQHTEDAQGQAGRSVSRPSLSTTEHQLLHQVPRQSQHPSHGLCSGVTQPTCCSQQTQDARSGAGGGVPRPSRSTNGHQTVHQAPRSSPCSTHTPFTLEAPPSYDSIFGPPVYSPLQVHSAVDQRHQLSIREPTVSVIETSNTHVLAFHTVNETSQIACSCGNPLICNRF